MKKINWKTIAIVILNILGLAMEGFCVYLMIAMFDACDREVGDFIEAVGDLLKDAWPALVLGWMGLQGRKQISMIIHKISKKNVSNEEAP